MLRGLRARVCGLDYPDIAELDAPAVRTEGEDVGHLPMRRHAHAEASRIPVNLGYLLAGRGLEVADGEVRQGDDRHPAKSRCRRVQRRVRR